MPFFEKSRNVELDDNVLCAECQDAEGSWRPARFHLNVVLGNFNGSFQWLGHHWSVFAKDIRLDGSVLSAQLQRFDCSWIPASVDLDERVTNFGGELLYEHSEGVFSRIGQSMSLEGVFGLTDAYDYRILDENELRIRDIVYAFQANIIRAGIDSVLAGLEPYRHTALSKPDSFRLLKIAPASGNEDVVHCSLEEASLNKPPPYAALSYTWGNPFPSTSPDLDRRYGQTVPIVCDGKCMRVGQNLYEALRRIRYSALEEARHEPYDKTDLIIEAENGSFVNVERLLREGADVAARDSFRNTALHYAAENGHVMIVKALVYAGSDIDALDCWGRTPLDCAREHHRGFWAQVEKFLVQQRDRTSVITRQNSCLRAQVTDVEYFWIDAICINQDDHRAKSADVAKMGDIYKQATKVVVWLGPMYSSDQDPTPGQLHGIWTLEGARVGQQIEDDVLDRMLTLFDTPNPSTVPVDDSDIASIAVKDWINTFEGNEMFDEWLLGPPLFRRSWFSRAWILQEVFMAKQITVVCGQYVIPWDILIFMSSFVEGIRAFRSKRADQKRIIGALLVSDQTERAPAVDLERRKRSFKSLGKLPMLNALSLTRNARASDPRDKVFSALSFSPMMRLVESGLEPIKPDYEQTTTELYTGVGKALVEIYGPRALSLAGLHRSPGCPNLPSWIPDLEVPLRASPNGLNIYDIGQDHPEFKRTTTGSFETDLFKITAKNELIIEGLMWDTIAEVTQPGLNDVGPELEHLASWIDLVSRLDLAPFERQQVLWRTLIEDQTATHPDTPSPHRPTDVQFHDWLIFLCYTSIFDLRDYLRSCVQSFKIPETQEAIVLSILNSPRVSSLLAKARSLFAALDMPFEPSSAIPSWLLELLASETQKERMDSESDVWQVWEYLAPRAEAFGNVIRSRDTSRRLMRSERMNAVGIAPEMAQVGDTICIVRGAQVPYVLRPIEDSKYRLVGEAYLYGVSVEQLLAEAMAEEKAQSLDDDFVLLSLEEKSEDSPTSIERICLV